MNRSSFLRHLSSDKSAALYSLFCAGLVIFGVAFFICFRAFESAKDNALVADRTAASFLAYFLAEHDKSTLGDLLSYAERPLLIKAVKQNDLATILVHLEGMKRNNPEIDLVFLTDRSATILANYPVFPEAIGQNVSDRDWYQGVSAQWQPYTSSVFQLIVADKPLAVAVVVPIKDEKGDIVGILGNSHRLDFMARIIQNNYLRPDTAMNILDRKGQILFSSKYPFRDKVAEYPLFSFLRRTKEQNGYTIEATETANNEGAVYLTPYSVGRTGWTVVVERTRADILRSVYGSFLEIGGIGALLFSLASIFLFYNRKVFELKTTQEQLVERKKAEEVLRESEEKYRALVESAPDAVLVHREGRFLYGNSKALTLYGAETLEQLQSRRVLDLIHPDDQPAVAERMQRGMAGQSLELRETKLVRLDGQVVPVESVGGAITYQGSPAVQIIVRDITARKHAEEALKEHERAKSELLEKLNEAQRMGKIGSWAWDLSRNNVWWSDETYRIFGVKPQDFVPSFESNGTFIHPDDFVLYRNAFEQSFKTGESLDFDVRLVLRDGQQKYCNAKGIIQYGDNAQPIRVVGSIMDITARKQAEDKLKANEKKLSEIYASMTEGLALHKIISDHSGKAIDYMITDVNPAFEKITGLNRDQIIGKKASAAYGTGEAPYLDTYAGVASTGKPVTFEVHFAPMNKYFNISVFSPDNGKFATIFQDITDRKLAEESVERLKALMDHNPSLAFLKDESGRYVYLNHAYEKQFVLSKDWYGKTDFDFWPKESAELFRANDYEILQSGQVKQYLEDSTDRNGTRYCWLVYKFSFADSNNKRYVGGIGINVTDRVRAEEALKEARDSLEQRVRERTMELQNLMGQLEGSRHELRKLASELALAEQRERKRISEVLHDNIAQMLAAIRMRLDLLQGMPSDQKDKQTLMEAKAFLVQSIQETRTLMNELGNPLLFDLGLKSACEALADRLMESNPVRIRCDIRDTYKDLNPDVKILLYQVVRELLNNIVKHSQAKTAHVVIDKENEHFKVTVTDDGVGFTTRMPMLPTVEGGYGLYSIRERLMAIDGSLRIESAPEAGTVVTAILPASLD